MPWMMEIKKNKIKIIKQKDRDIKHRERERERAEQKRTEAPWVYFPLFLLSPLLGLTRAETGA